MGLIIRVFVIFTYYLTFGTSDDPNEPNFRIEYIDWVWRSMSPHQLFVTGPILPSNKEYLEKLCDAAKNYASLDPNPEYHLSVCLEPGRITYPNDERTQFEHLHILWCNTIPQIWLRATENGEFVIMIEYSIFVNDERLFFHVETTKVDPEPCSDENEDNRLRTYFNSKDSLHICWNAKKNVEFQKPILYSSDVSGQLFAFQYENGTTEKHVALKCPSLPNMYVYFGDSETDIRVILVRKSYRKRERKSATPHHHVPLNLVENA